MPSSHEVNETIAGIAAAVKDVSPEEIAVIERCKERHREYDERQDAILRRERGYRPIVNLGTGRKEWIRAAEDVHCALLQPPGAGHHNDKWRCADCGGEVHDGDCH